jgi:hypothetical protein
MHLPRADKVDFPFLKRIRLVIDQMLPGGTLNQQHGVVIVPVRLISFPGGAVVEAAHVLQVEGVLGGSVFQR